MSTNNLSLTLPLTPRTLNTPMEDVRHLPQFKTQIHIIFYRENQTLKRHEYFAQKKKKKRHEYFNMKLPGLGGKDSRSGGVANHMD
jgi:hypothetical protein